MNKMMNNNGILYRSDGSKRLTDNTLVALTLMIAESKTEEKEQKERQRNTVKNINVNEVDIDIELIKRMVEWDRRHRVLEDWKFKVMQDVAIGLKPLTEKLKWGFRLNLKLLLLRGFDEL